MNLRNRAERPARSSKASRGTTTASTSVLGDALGGTALVGQHAGRRKDTAFPDMHAVEKHPAPGARPLLHPHRAGQKHQEIVGVPAALEDLRAGRQGDDLAARKQRSGDVRGWSLGSAKRAIRVMRCPPRRQSALIRHGTPLVPGARVSSARPSCSRMQTQSRNNRAR